MGLYFVVVVVRPLTTCCLYSFFFVVVVRLRPVVPVLTAARDQLSLPLSLQVYHAHVDDGPQIRKRFHHLTRKDQMIN